MTFDAILNVYNFSDKTLFIDAVLVLHTAPEVFEGRADGEEGLGDLLLLLLVGVHVAVTQKKKGKSCQKL